MNRLYYGDCMTVMQELPDQSVDLIYLDPPFNSQRGYNAIYTTETGQPLPDQIEAFCDMWELDAEREQAIRHMPVLMREAGVDDDVAEFWRIWMNALRTTQPRLLAYLSYMVQRLLPMRRLLKPTGSLYYHCDPTAAHYIKVMLDGIFGHQNFRNDIIWRRNESGAKGSQHDPISWGSNVDYLLYYTKGAHPTFHPRIIKALDDEDARRKFPKVNENGERYNTKLTAWRQPSMGDRPNLCYAFHGISPPYPSGWRLSKKRMEEEYDKGNIVVVGGKLERRSYAKDYRGVSPGNLWTAKELLLGAQSHERLDYPTQKPSALLERIIAASSNPGDMVLDPFCGCATTMEAAQKLGRNWIGIDIAIHAVKRVARVRLEERLGLVEDVDFTIEGVPRNVEGARDLWTRDKYQFQKWAVEQADGFVTSKRTADGGIDGRLYFYAPDYSNLAPGDTPLSDTLESMVIEVKGGRNVSIADVRALRGVLDADDASMAGLIVLDELSPTKARNFARFMGEAGTVEIMGNEYPKMQIMTVAELLDGRRFATPTVAGQRTQLQPAIPGWPQSSP